ncbi:SAM-dependent DNA methyltransferase [Deinococcus detaillensis]|uniref:site-specific DNA-methyltransferase (adenine-specific) n=1 Tax=Deinococcus detaillensis TaxID=2592048 RepID=A0A553UPL3_9DEIO|nr:DNA methyltransferase [Deinococcus detaillensis]TSA82146.1 SAM-dependent DNA methyltransferase [Deinococcus detaillensis]
MSALETPLRKILEKKVIAARDTAEVAAEAALARLIGDGAAAPRYLSADEVTLREALLAKQKQLGSREALIRECAYEQWHAMLFARFLEASDLLMHPEHGVSVSMDDLGELAQEEGDAGAYAAAARYAAHMLPGIFRPSDPLLRVTLAPEARQTLERLLDEIPKPAYTADDGLGWVYQFWQTEQKKRVNDSGRKIAGADISPVTQLFTEHYMVQFMLHNTVGAWWTARHPDTPLPTEKSYLRLNDDGTPAAGAFPGWPATVKELKVIDPSCGSGHFLVAAFALLRRLRVLEEGLSETEAADAVLRDNLYGLELDPRCTQLAAFNLTLEAWKVGGYRALPTPHIACSGLSIGASVEDWLQFADDNNTRNVFRVLHEEFRDAPDLGSLINPREGIRQRLGIFGDEALDGLPELIDTLLEREQTSDPAAAIYGENVQGVVKSAAILQLKYNLVITNVPYLGRPKQADTIRDLGDARYPHSKADLATMFVERALEMCQIGGSACLVVPQSWQFLGRYEGMRISLLNKCRIDWIARLGFKSFSTPMWDLNISLDCFTNQSPGQDEYFIGIDASMGNFEVKESSLRLGEATIINQQAQLANPDKRIIISGEVSKGELLSEYAIAPVGLMTGDTPRHLQLFWEQKSISEPYWQKCQTSDSSKADIGGNELIVEMQTKNGESPYVGYNVIVGRDAWGKDGVAISVVGSLAPKRYMSQKFDKTVAAVIPKKKEYLDPLWCFLTSDEFLKAVRKVDQKLIVTNKTLLKVPFDLPYWQQVAAEKYPDGLPEPYSNDPTQWLFKGTVTDTTEPLQVALARLLGYRWPEQLDDGIVPDTDGIVPLVALLGERAAHERLLDVLASVYGVEWKPAKLTELLAQVGADSLEGWLAGKFFEQHAKLFHHRPFLWHIWDGRKDGFSAIVNYHTLDRARLEKLTYSYLGAWIDRQRGSDEKGADVRLAAALELQRKLEAVLTGEPPYDIYVRWKELSEQPRGWNPDLNDGVRLNIRPFVEAGVLRGKVNVKWGKDRGNDPGKKDFGERGPQTDLEKHLSNERHNDLHFKLAEKGTAGSQGGQG